MLVMVTGKASTNDRSGLFSPYFELQLSSSRFMCCIYAFNISQNELQPGCLGGVILGGHLRKWSHRSCGAELTAFGVELYGILLL